MNTPKLISPISSALGAIDASRSGKGSSANGLDFALLLGEKRSEVAPPAPRQSPQTVQPRSDANRSRSDTTAAREPSQQESSAAASTAPKTTEQTASRSNDNSAARSDSSGTSAPTQGSGSPAADSSEPGNGATSGEAVAANGSEPAQAETASPEAAPAQDAQLLAQEVAESGLPGAVVIASAVAGTATSSTEGEEVGKPALPATLQAQLASTEAEAEFGLPAQQRLGTLAGFPSTEQTVGTPLSRIDNIETFAPQAGKLAAFVEESARRPAQTLAFEPAGSAVSLPAAAVKNANTPFPATALPLPVQNEFANTAAALSLQLEEFNAMVAAARATSGTSLQPLASPVETAFVQPTALPVPGMMPVGTAPGFISAAPAVGSINAPLSSPQWPTELGRQFISISQAAKGLGQVAELRLDPPDLGPLRITINLNDNVAHAVFSSPHAIVRQTVENALPQLQQMLEQAGISLGQANVNDQHQSGQAPEGFAQGNNRNSHGTGASAAAGMVDESDVRPGRAADPNSLVDTFA